MKSPSALKARLETVAPAPQKPAPTEAPKATSESSLYIFGLEFELYDVYKTFFSVSDFDTESEFDTMSVRSLRSSEVQVRLAARDVTSCCL